MPPKEKSSAILVLVIVALIAVLLYAAWHWIQRTDSTPKAPLHSGIYASKPALFTS